MERRALADAAHVERLHRGRRAGEEDVDLHGARGGGIERRHLPRRRLVGAATAGGDQEGREEQKGGPAHGAFDLGDGSRSVKFGLDGAARVAGRGASRYGRTALRMRTRLTDFRDRVALVTGASSGIGARLAGDLAARGVRVALVARRAERLEQLAAELGPSRAMAIACDVSSRPAVEAAVARVLDHWDRLDLLVNNAGLARHGLFKDEDPDTFARLMEINYLGTVWAIRAVLPAMRRRGEGWIVNVSSVAGKLGQPDESAYTASKFAVTGLSEALVVRAGAARYPRDDGLPGAGAHRDVHARESWPACPNA